MEPALESDVALRYQATVDNADEDFFRGDVPSRTPYRRNVGMGRGAHYYDAFKEFITNGGIGAYKNAVVMNFRLNFVGNLDMIGESFEAAFFLDLAYWVPRFDREHHSNPDTIKLFAKYEPHFDFPDTDYELKGRETEFSRDPLARQHECQLGQNAETASGKSKDDKKKKGHLGNPQFNTAPRAFRTWLHGDDLQPDPAKTQTSVKKPVKKFVRVGDKTSHWPRLWRTLVSDAELRELERMPREERRKKEPSNERPEAMHRRLRELCAFLDARRLSHLSHPEEGIVFVTYDVAAKKRQVFRLHQFPYDFQELCLTVRLTRAHGDALNRHIVPVAHDKAFFCSGRGVSGGNRKQAWRDGSC